jgi:ATP-dependent DNA helicase RecG
MQTLPLSEVKARLSEIADEVHQTHERVYVNRNGRDFVVLLSKADLDSLEATLELLTDQAAQQRLAEDVRANLPKGASKLLDILRLEGRPMSTGQIAEVAGIARPTASRRLQTLRAIGIVVWDGQGPQDPRASWSLH